MSGGASEPDAADTGPMFEEAAADRRRGGDRRRGDRRVGNSPPRSSHTVVAIGGGRGLAATLAALRAFVADPVAVVSVADDGGSTGRLRRAGSSVVPGDLRKSLVALADGDSTLARSLDLRFARGELAGHAVGNLLLAALAEVTGDLVTALDELSALVGARGRVLPAAGIPVTLRGRTVEGAEVVGQVAVMSTAGLWEVGFDPPEPPVPGPVLQAIADASLIVLGPGSLYTSVLAAAAVPGIRDALAAATAPKVYVCNLHSQIPESDGYSVADHVAALVRHGVRPDVVLFDPETSGDAAGVLGARPVELRGPGERVHDPVRLGRSLQDVLSVAD